MAGVTWDELVCLFLGFNLSILYSNLSPAFRPVDLGVEGFASPPLHALKPCPLGPGGAYSGLKAGVLNRVGIRIKEASNRLNPSFTWG
jgi:hypothetical protein